MNDVFVTGATGFIGFHLVSRLRRLGCRVRCLVRPNSNRRRLEPLGVEFVEGDLSSRDVLRSALSGADTLIHLAGLTWARSNPRFFDVNQLGCRTLAEIAAAQDKPSVVVNVSSLAAAGAAIRLSKSERKIAGQKFAPLTERHVPCPVSVYGKSKLAGESEWANVADRVPVTIVRPAIVFGEGDALCRPLFTMARTALCFLIPGYRDFPFSFVHADDLSELILAAAEHGERITPAEDRTDSADEKQSVGTGIYFAAHPEMPLWSQFGRMLAEAVGRKSQLRMLRCPPLAVLGVGAVQETFKRLTGIPVPLDWEKAKESLGGPWICSGDKARSQLGVKFDETLQEQLHRTAVWYRDNA